MTLSVWATTMLSLYTKVQVNILGRHLYIDTARSLGISDSGVRTTVFFLYMMSFSCLLPNIDVECYLGALGI